jgi:hypothetical protein
MCTTVPEIVNGNQFLKDGIKKGNTICARPFQSGGIMRKTKET